MVPISRLGFFKPLFLTGFEILRIDNLKKAFTLKSDTIKAVILNYGGVIQSLETPDKNGVWDDITTGFETIEEYPEKSQFFGCLGKLTAFYNKVY